jgi:hypothetical protein
MYAGHPRNELRVVFITLLDGALETWQGFGSDILVFTDAQKLKAMMPAKTVANEGLQCSRDNALVPECDVGTRQCHQVAKHNALLVLSLKGRHSSSTAVLAETSSSNSDQRAP